MKVEVIEEYTDLSRQQKQCNTPAQHGSLLNELGILGLMGKVFIWKCKFETSGDAQETVAKSTAKH